MVVLLAEEVEVIGGAVACADTAVVDALVDALAEALDVPAAAEFTAAVSGNVTVTSVRFTYTRPRP
jgi:hypothetical protein